MGGISSLRTSSNPILNTCEAYKRALISTKITLLNFNNYPTPHP